MDAGCASDWIWQWRWLDKLDCAGYLRHPFAKSVVFYERMTQVASTSSKILKTPYHAPRANAICERFLLSVRRECLDHVLILSEKQLHRVLRANVAYFNRARPHQGIQQQVPQGAVPSVPPDQRSNRIISVSVLGGLHHEYRRIA